MTTKDLKIRISNHITRANRGWPGKLYNAIRKYGIESFDVVIVAKSKNTKRLLELEKYWIKRLNTFKHGYNLTEGGEGTFGWKPDIKWRRKLRKINLGKKYSPERCLQMSKTFSGSGNPMFGTTWSKSRRRKIVRALKRNRALHAPKSEETRAKMSISNKAAKRLKHKKYLYAGKRFILLDWAIHFGIKRSTLWRRINQYGMTFKEAVERPVRKHVLKQ